MDKHIFLGNPFYNKSKWNSDSAFATALSEYGKTIYIPTNFTFLRSLFKGEEDIDVFYNYLKGKREYRVSDNLKVCNMPPLLHLGIAKSKFFNIKEYLYEIEFARFANNVKKFCRNISFSQAIIWSSSLYIHKFRKLFPRNKLIYYVVDDLRYFSDKVSEFVEKNEIKNANKCDYVVTISKKLTDRFESYGAKVIESNIGITLKDHKLNNLPEIRNIGNALIAYVGYLADYIDYELLKLILNTFNNINLIIIGPKKINTNELIKNNLNNHENIYCIDSVNIQKLFDILNSIDVCILPYKINELTEASDPMKMYDYIQSGKAIVAIKINESMGRFAPFAYLCKERREFLNYIGEILKGNLSFSYLEGREEFIKSNSWNTIVGKILKFIK